MPRASWRGFLRLSLVSCPIYLSPATTRAKSIRLHQVWQPTPVDVAEDAWSDYAELERLWRRLQPLAMPDMPLDVPPPRDSRFGSPLILSRVHWVRPELVAEVEFLTWTEDNLLRQVVYEGLREDKPSTDVRRPIPHPQPGR